MSTYRNTSIRESSIINGKKQGIRSQSLAFSAFCISHPCVKSLPLRKLPPDQPSHNQWQQQAQS